MLNNSFFFGGGGGGGVFISSSVENKFHKKNSQIHPNTDWILTKR